MFTGIVLCLLIQIEASLQLLYPHHRITPAVIRIEASLQLLYPHHRIAPAVIRIKAILQLLYPHHGIAPTKSSGVEASFSL
jgi:hypothetical protein